MALKDTKIKSMLPQGVNRIEHSIRIKLGLSCEEYCIFDTILSRKKQSKPTQFIDIENHTGLLPSVIDSAIHKMINMTLLEINKNNNYMLNRIMVDNAFQDLNELYKKEFEIFWKKEIKVKNKKGEFESKFLNRWPGPKPLAFDKFVIARKKFSMEFIMKQVSDYFKLLEDKTWRDPMQASKFLNITSGQIEEDFRSQWPDHFKKELKETKPITKEQKDLLYK